MPRRTGRLTLLGLGVLLWVGGSRAAAQVSPGPLARAHQSLEGPTNCTRCHAGGGGGNTGMNERCLDCHKEIRWLITAGRGFHANDPGAKCSTCHPDHAGADFQMIKWPDA